MAGEKAELRRALEDVFGLKDFRPGQRQAAQALMKGRDTLCLMPTGGGKSLCWQLPAAVKPGWTLAVSPLIALQRDQASHLAARGVNALCLDSLQSPEERERVLRALEQGRARILFVSPERLQTERFRSLCRRYPPWLMVVDEAHCIPRWGEGFRPAYGQIGRFIEELTPRPVVCALTATADRPIRRAIREGLGLRHPRVVTLPAFRENLRLCVRSTIHPEEEILRAAAEHAGEKMLIFCRTRARAEQLARMLRGRGVHADHYHAGMDRQSRLTAQERFAAGETAVLAATTAFGMGIDLPDIRLVIHERLPDSLIDYAQQAGRAGRDGRRAQCLMLLDPADLEWRRRWREDGARSWRGFLRERGKRRDFRELLAWCLSGRCLWAGLARRLGQRMKPCGHCSACERARRQGGGFRPLAPTPPLSRMSAVALRAWALRWQREAMARAAGCRPGRVLPEGLLWRSARVGCVPRDAELPRDVRARFEAVLRHMDI